MSKQLMEIVLPRLARRLHGQLKRYHAGKLDDAQFTRSFESLLQRQYAWLAEHGVSEKRAALALHSAVLILSRPGLTAEAEEQGVPLEVIEFRAVRTAAEDISRNYGIGQAKACRIISTMVALYGD
ncbi:MAG: hypothetical protein K2R98_21830 [Gemmataceae bacterium]|nr:hypothetical protein [Gemmataceae bacterium]